MSDQLAEQMPMLPGKRHMSESHMKEVSAWLHSYEVIDIGHNTGGLAYLIEDTALMAM